MLEGRRLKSYLSKQRWDRHSFARTVEIVIFQRQWYFKLLFFVKSVLILKLCHAKALMIIVFFYLHNWAQSLLYCYEAWCELIERNASILGRYVERLTEKGIHLGSFIIGLLVSPPCWPLIIKECASAVLSWAAELNWHRLWLLLNNLILYDVTFSALSLSLSLSI